MEENPYKSPAEFERRTRQRRKLRLGEFAALAVAVVVAALVGALALAGK